MNEQLLLLQLERLDRAFPDRDTLTRRELARYDGISEKTVVKLYPFRRGKPIAKIAVARVKAGG